MEQLSMLLLPTEEQLEKAAHKEEITTPFLEKLKEPKPFKFDKLDAVRIERRGLDGNIIHSNQKWWMIMGRRRVESIVKGSMCNEYDLCSDMYGEERETELEVNLVLISKHNKDAKVIT